MAHMTFSKGPNDLDDVLALNSKRWQAYWAFVSPNHWCWYGTMTWESVEECYIWSWWTCWPQNMTCVTTKWHVGLLYRLSHSDMNLKHIEAETKWLPFCRQHFKLHFLEWKYINLFKISLKFVPRGPINNIPALVQIMALHWPGDR